MAITNPYEGSVTVSTTELSLVSGTSTLQSNTTAGIYQVMLDLNAMASGDAFRLRIKEVVQSAGTQRVVQDVTLRGAQGQPVYTTPSLLLMNGWDVTLVKSQGTDRVIPYSIRKVA